VRVELPPAAGSSRDRVGGAARRPGGDEPAPESRPLLPRVAARALPRLRRLGRGGAARGDRRDRPRQRLAARPVRCVGRGDRRPARCPCSTLRRVEPEQSLRGQLLIASPALLDPNFARTVVLVVEHNDEGAMGIVLNRPSTAAVAEAVPPLEDLVGEDEAVFVGGPVEPAAVVVLAEFEDTDAAAAIVFGDLGFLRADADPSVLDVAARRFRVFAGYSGWGAGQLEAE